MTPTDSSVGESRMGLDLPVESKKMNNRNKHIALIIAIFTTTSFCIVDKVTYAGNKQVRRMEEINRLLEAASIKSPSIPVPEEIQNSKDWEKRRQYFEQRHLRFQEVEDKREKARNELAAMGDDVIDPLLKIFRGAKFDDAIIMVLKRIGTAKARGSLLNIALEPKNKSYESTRTAAARSYIALTNDKEDVKKLLASSDDDTLSVALQNLPGVTIDTELLKRLDELLQSTQYHPVLNFAIRTKATAVIAADTGSVLMQEKVLAIVKSLDTVEQMPKSNERFQYNRVGTFADRTYWLLARSLEKMKGIDTYLSQATNRRTGNPHRWLLAVRANRGDSSVKSQVHDSLEDPNMLERTVFRSYALQGYGKIGTTEDIDFLRGIAESDPVIMLNRGGLLLEIINGKPINNAGERGVIYDEFTIPEWERLSPRQRRPFIREDARQAIKAIQSVIPLDGKY